MSEVRTGVYNCKEHPDFLPPASFSLANYDKYLLKVHLNKNLNCVIFKKITPTFTVGVKLNNKFQK